MEQRLLDLASLSEQERNVLDLVALGMTNREIAARLHLAEKTVRNYVSNVLTKLGSRNRTEAAVRITRQMHRSHPSANRQAAERPSSSPERKPPA